MEVQIFGIREGRRFAELGLRSAVLSGERWLEKLSAEPLLLRLPLVRNRHQVTVGPAEDVWREWVSWK